MLLHESILFNSTAATTIAATDSLYICSMYIARLTMKITKQQQQTCMHYADASLSLDRILTRGELTQRGTCDITGLAQMVVWQTHCTHLDGSSWILQRRAVSARPRSATHLSASVYACVLCGWWKTQRNSAGGQFSKVFALLRTFACGSVRSCVRISSYNCICRVPLKHTRTDLIPATYVNMCMLVFFFVSTQYFPQCRPMFFIDNFTVCISD